MIGILLAYVIEVFSRAHIVQHNGSAHLVEKLLLEVLALVLHFSKSLGSLRQHVLLRFFIVAPNFVNLLN